LKERLLQNNGIIYSAIFHRTVSDCSLITNLFLNILNDKEDSWGNYKKTSFEIWSKALNLAISCYIVPFLFYKLKEKECLHLLPKEIKEAFYKEYIFNTARNLQIFNELSNILQLLKQNNIDCIVLKGGYLASKIYPQIGLRVLFDIDLLFQEKDLASAQKILIKHGYMNSSLISLDLHWYLEQFLDLDMQYVWQNTLRTEIEDAPALVLCPEINIIHLCIHMGMHHLFQDGALRALCDIKELIIKQKKIDWLFLNKLCERWGVKECVLLSLKIVDEFLGLPENISIKKSFNEVDVELLEWAKKQIICHPYSETGSKDLSPYFWKLWSEESLIEKIKAFKRLIFPPKEMVSQKYPSVSGSINNRIKYIKRFREFIFPYLRITMHLITRQKDAVQKLNSRKEKELIRKRLAPKGKWIYR